MSLTTLLNTVEGLTARPDARLTAQAALNSLLLEITTAWDYPQDLVEVTLQVSSDALVESSVVLPLNLVALGYPPVRKIEYLAIQGLPMEQISPRHALTQAGCQRQRVYYRSGATLVINAGMGFDHVRLGYYQGFTPLIEGATGQDQHWFLEAYEPMLVNAVAARVFMATGDDTSSGYYEQLYRVQRSKLESDFQEV